MTFIVILSSLPVPASGLVGLIQPMLWDYNPGLNVEETGRTYTADLSEALTAAKTIVFI